VKARNEGKEKEDKNSMQVKTKDAVSSKDKRNL